MNSKKKRLGANKNRRQNQQMGIDNKKTTRINKNK